MFVFPSCVYYAVVHVCLFLPCGHLLGKGWPLGSSLWCLIVSCHFPIGILGQVWYLIVSIPDLCILTYFELVNKFLVCQSSKNIYMHYRYQTRKYKSFVNTH